jgi:RNA recognition motif-containing protein
MKHHRIIIRNLVFDINEKHIKKLLLPFGDVKEINIPTNPDGKGTKGFAFVEMSN